jgi:hypothetical protein
MGVISARPGDFVRCLVLNDQAACRRIYIGYWLWPRLQKLLEDLEVLQPLPKPWPEPWPRPDPPPDRLEELIPVLLGQSEHAFSTKFRLVDLPGTFHP